MSTRLSYIPTEVTGGETIWISVDNTVQPARAVDIIVPGFLPADYVLTYDFTSPTPSTVTAVANGAGTGWGLTVTSASTITWKAGTITYVGKMTATVGGMVFVVDQGTIAVTASPLLVSGYAAALTAIDAAIADYATNPMGSFSLGDMNVSFRSLQELLDLRGHLQYMVNKDTAGRTKRKILTRLNIV